MRIGEKCKFVLSENMYALKAGRKYTGIYAGGDRVRYQRFIVVPEEIIPIQKTTVKKEKAPTASDYKNFGDLCFECGVRYRDDWTSVISGKRFEEGDWNGLQAGHGCSRQYWDTRHIAVNCHAITSGENYQMSLGNPTTILKYWKYVEEKYGSCISERLVNYEHETTKLSIAYLKADCIKQYEFLATCIHNWCSKWKIMQKDVDSIIKWRCEKFPKAKTDGIMKVLNIIKGEQ